MGQDSVAGWQVEIAHRDIRHAGFRRAPDFQGNGIGKVQVSAAGLLEEFLPVGSDGETTVEAPDEATLIAVMQAAGIPEGAKPLISLNGTMVPRSRHAVRTVADGDAVHFMLNLKGG